MFEDTSEVTPRPDEEEYERMFQSACAMMDEISANEEDYKSFIRNFEGASESTQSEETQKVHDPDVEELSRI